MEFAEYIGVIGAFAALLTLQGYWIGRAIGRVETSLDSFKAEVHADMAVLTEHVAGLRERMAKLDT